MVKRKTLFYSTSKISLIKFYGSFLSWKTRNVTISALNDSRYIGLSVYIVFICCTLGSLVIFIPSEQIQFSYFLRSFFIVICTTATVCLVFVPKVKYFKMNLKKKNLIYDLDY
jgi:gamma-aminobutyric acid type B receptor